MITRFPFPRCSLLAGDSAGAGRVASALALGLVLLPSAVMAANTPAVPVPEERWGSPPVMQPIKILHDSTHYDGGSIPTADTPIFFDLDLSGDYLFSVTGKGLMVHDLSGNLEDPKRVGYTYGFGVVPTWLQSDLKFYFYDVSAPDANPDVAVTVGAAMGVLVWDFSNRSNPNIHYQDYDDSHGGPDGNGLNSAGDSVWATTLGTTSYAFTAHGLKGVGIWNLDNAAKYSRCDYASGGCPDVWMGKVPVDGFNAISVHGAGSFVAVGLNRDGLEIWNVANPAAPTRVLKGDPGQVVEVQLWQDGSKYYLATLDPNTVNGLYMTSIWDVSCIASGTCATASPLSQPVAHLKGSDDRLSELTVSQSEGRTYLYAGHLDRFASGDQREFLWDVSDPETMDESVAGAQELFPDNPPGEGYPGWYYARNDTGFQNFAPVAAVVRGGYVFRSAWTVYDSHELLGAAPPVADFDWSPKASDLGHVYGGQTITFTDQSAGGPTSWFWTFSGAGATKSQSELQNPSLAFKPASFPATATVTLAARNEAGTSDPVSKSVTVIDPKPVVKKVTASPTSALVCQQITFTADATGRPTLSYAWKVKDGGGAQVASGNGNPFTWQTGSATSPGSYTGEVTVTNTAGSAVESSSAVTLDMPESLAIDSLPDPDVSFGTVQFSSQTTGAASWTWDYGDGETETLFTQAEGEGPVHTYTQADVDAVCAGDLPCTFTVTLTVDNCLKEPVSAQVQVTIQEIDPLEINVFAAECQCQLGCNVQKGCFQVDKPVEFVHDVGGDPDKYEYDWDGDGTWDQTATAPVTSHTYKKADTYLPMLRVTRGTEPSVVAENGTGSCNNCTSGEITVSPTDPPSISISGPSSGQTGQNLSFSASATNCTPAASGWTWSATGLSVSDTDASITVSFPSAGSKTITAKNSACGSATGAKLVSISDPDDGGGGDPGGDGDDVTARFSITPSQPEAGEPVTFDASTSLGTINSYSWSIDDQSAGTGVTLVHTFSDAGSYTVKLSVSGPGDCEGQVGGASGICTDTESKKVTVRTPNAVSASFEDDADCGGGQVGGGFCSIATGQEITFTDTSTGPVTGRSWDFGDGSTGTGKSATHAWSQPDTYTVTLTVQGEDSSSTATKTYIVSGDPVAQVRNLVVPWISQSDADKALPQSSDLVIHNPGEAPLKVKVTFRKRGLPEVDPPTVELTIAPKATHHEADIVKDLFDRPNLSGFLLVEPLEGSAEPVVSSVNRTFLEDGRVFGQVVPGFPVDDLPAATAGGPQVFHLVGLNANTDRLAYFGISNPSDQPLSYHLRFYDSLGRLVDGTDEPQTVARFGQKQYQSDVLAEHFGVDHLDDYRIEIETAEGSPRPYVYGANLRLASKDPSFLRVGRIDASEVFLLGVLSTPGLNESLFQSDLVLGNTSSATTLCDLTFTPTGFQAEPTAPVSESLPGRESLRLEDVVSQWDLGATVGVLRVACDSPSDVFPVVQGESYDVSRPEELYGQFMPALTLEDAAREGGRQVLAGLQQDPENRTTIWLFNPGDEVARYSVRYLDLQGNDLGGESDLPLGSGKFRQINPGHHPFVEESGPISGPGGFVVVVEVAKGRVLSAAQVVNAANDPAYIVGQ